MILLGSQCTKLHAPTWSPTGLPISLPPHFCSIWAFCLEYLSFFLYLSKSSSSNFRRTEKFRNNTPLP